MKLTLFILLIIISDIANAGFVTVYKYAGSYGGPSWAVTPVSGYSFSSSSSAANAGCTATPLATGYTANTSIGCSIYDNLGNYAFDLQINVIQLTYDDTDCTFNESSGVCEALPPSQDCSSETISQMLFYDEGSMAEPQPNDTLNVEGCGQTVSLAGAVCVGGRCGVSVIGTGTALAGEYNTEVYDPADTASIETPFIFEVFDKGYNTNAQLEKASLDNLDGTFTDTLVTQEIVSQPKKINVFTDGSIKTETETGGGLVNIVNSSVTNIFADGASSTTKTVSTTTSSGGTGSIITDVLSGQQTNSQIPPVTINTLKTIITQKDSTGNITSQTSNTDVYEQVKQGKTLEDLNATDCGYGTHPECKTDIGEAGEFSSSRETDGQEIGDSINSYWTGLNSIPLVTAVSGITLPASSGCPTSSFDSYLGTFVFDYHCTLIESIRDILTFVMLAVWGFIGFRITMSA